MILSTTETARRAVADYHPAVIERDVLSKDRETFEASGDAKYMHKAHRRGKIGWNVGRRIELAPHYRRPHMALARSERGRVVHRRGSVVHRELLEKVPSGLRSSMVSTARFRNDHEPPHFHVKRRGEWEVKVFFLLAPDDMIEILGNGRPSKRELKALTGLAEKHRLELLEQWQQIRESEAGG